MGKEKPRLMSVCRVLQRVIEVDIVVIIHEINQLSGDDVTQCHYSAGQIRRNGSLRRRKHTCSCALFSQRSKPHVLLKSEKT